MIRNIVSGEHLCSIDGVRRTLTFRGQEVGSYRKQKATFRVGRYDGRGKIIRAAALLQFELGVFSAYFGIMLCSPSPHSHKHGE